MLNNVNMLLENKEHKINKLCMRFTSTNQHCYNLEYDGYHHLLFIR